MDRRLLASNGQVADKALEGQVEAEQFVEPQPRLVSENAWLRRSPDGAIDRECLVGDRFDAIETREGHVFGRAAKDGYVGWLPSHVLTDFVEPTHWIAVRTTWAYQSPSFKTEPAQVFHLTSRVAVTARSDGWAAISGGTLFLPERHLLPIGTPLDLVTAARSFLGTPYVWAGNSGFGIDCSGLVQVSAHAAGFSCAPDSDLQEKMPGVAVDLEDGLEVGDLVFWRGHVALATGSGTLIHANAHHMAVVEEPASEAVRRIAGTDTGPVTSILRPDWSSFW